MDTENIFENNYKLGFNEGYVIGKHLPALSVQIAEIKNETARIDGLKDGIKESILERTREHHPSWLNKEQHKKNKPLDRDLEPDI